MAYQGEVFTEYRTRNSKLLYLESVPVRKSKLRRTPRSLLKCERVQHVINVMSDGRTKQRVVTNGRTKQRLVTNGRTNQRLVTDGRTKQRVVTNGQTKQRVVTDGRTESPPSS